MPRNVAAGSKREWARGSVRSRPGTHAPRRITVDHFLAALGDVPFFALAVRMAAVAVFIVIGALISERAGPFFGAMVTSLPVYTGPVYLFLAIDHPPEFLAQVTVGSLGSCAVIPVFVVLYALMARAGHSALPSLLVALVAWVCVATIVQLKDWTLIEALVFALPIYGVTILIGRSFTQAVALTPTGRSWRDLMLRVLMVTCVVGAVNAMSPFLPVKVTGMLSIMPTVMMSLILVLHGRIGGPATAALLIHAITGMVGMLLAVTLVGLTIVPWGPAASLSAGLAMSLSWNLTLIAIRQAGRALRDRRPDRRR
jgi:hypothetical protein